ncbi:hypothetical protein ESB13_22040 [Filimonas effusa]|uniref:Carrier domain-containing protein n=2 Tax=Filimonas effusa TaxID=2508721 RepID=A0A4Q1D050_9BACT|nr:hypothetical protein ESB13_22040 [Filimonas effusa]
MGLDSVELVMEVEKTFNISIPDEEASQCTTVGELHDTVARHLNNIGSRQCASQLLFYRLRRALGELAGMSPKAITPAHVPEELFPKDNRRKIYKEFAANLNLQMPPLDLSAPWSQLLTSFGLLTIGGGLALALILVNFYDVSKWSLLIPLGSIVVMLLLSQLFNPFRNVVAAPTLREFTGKVLVLNYAALKRTNGVNRKEMELVINQIIADKAGFEIGEIAPHQKFGDDLGLD